MKTILAVLLITCSLVHVAWAATPDIVIDGNSKITINKVTPQVIDSLQNYDKKDAATVEFTELASQSSFDSVIKNNIWIKRIYIKSGNTLIFNIRAVALLENLESLRIQGLKESERVPIDLAPLARLTNLAQIDFHGTRVTNAKSLSNLVKLEKINLYSSNVDSIDFLKNTPNVKQLILYGDGHTFKNYLPLANLTQLEELDLRYNPQVTNENMDAIKGLKSLKVIFIYIANITHINFLKDMTELTEVNVDRCPNLTDISGLKSAQKLLQLSLDDTSVEQLGVLKGKNQLNRLDVSESKVNNIAVLSDFINLKHLDVRDTEVTDVTPLLKLSALRTIWLNEKVPPEQIESIKKKFPDANVSVN